MRRDELGGGLPSHYGENLVHQHAEVLTPELHPRIHPRMDDLVWKRAVADVISSGEVILKWSGPLIPGDQCPYKKITI